MTASPRLELKNLTITHDGGALVSDLSLTLAAHRITALVGESGSGKSMTALAIMGLLPQGCCAQGSVLLNGTDSLLGLSDRKMCQLRGRRIGMIFQEPMTALNPVLQIGAQVAETLMVHRITPNRRAAMAQARTVLDRVGLAQIALDRYPHELSGGQRQRVAIAAAIAAAPDVLIADEATTALDVTTQQGILALLKTLVAEDGMALLLITHDLAVVASMADEVAVMNQGRIIEKGETKRLLSRPRDPYTKALLSAARPAPKETEPLTGETLLSVEGVSRIYPPKRLGLRKSEPFVAVRDANLTLKRGECLGIVGGSGCGKSTLARAILGLEAAQSGRIVLDGTEVHPNMPLENRRRLSIVFQDPYGSFDPRWRVGRVIAEPLDLQNVPSNEVTSRVATALEQVGLSPQDAQKYPHQFSGGQRQRIAIARALITRPDIVVLDEAVSALDVSVRARVLDLLKSLQQELQLSYIFITHDLTVVAHMADTIAVMENGVIVEQGPAPQILSGPRHPYTQNLLNTAPRLDAAPKKGTVS